MKTQRGPTTIFRTSHLSPHFPRPSKGSEPQKSERKTATHYKEHNLSFRETSFAVLSHITCLCLLLLQASRRLPYLYIKKNLSSLSSTEASTSQHHDVVDISPMFLFRDDAYPVETSGPGKRSTRQWTPTDCNFRDDKTDGSESLSPNVMFLLALLFVLLVHCRTESDAARRPSDDRRTFDTRPQLVVASRHSCHGFFARESCSRK